MVAIKVNQIARHRQLEKINKEKDHLVCFYKCLCTEEQSQDLLRNLCSFPCANRACKKVKKKLTDMHGHEG